MAAKSIDQFCQANGISRSLFYLLRKRGQGPREMAVGNRRLISDDAERDWQKAREADAAHQPAPEAA